MKVSLHATFWDKESKHEESKKKVDLVLHDLEMDAPPFEGLEMYMVEPDWLEELVVSAVYWVEEIGFQAEVQHVALDNFEASIADLVNAGWRR
jgi:hypothetical protein